MFFRAMGFLCSLMITSHLAQSDDGGNRPQPPGSVYVKVILPEANPEQTEGPSIESWIAARLDKRGVDQSRAVTEWVELDANQNHSVSVWNAMVDGKGWGCPVGGSLGEKENGNIEIALNGWTPAGADLRGEFVPFEIGSRRIIRVGHGKQETIAYVAVFVGPPSKIAGESLQR